LPNIFAGLAHRSRIVLRVADGLPLTHVAAMVGIPRRFVYKWVWRFLEDGLLGLADKSALVARAGHRRQPWPGKYAPA